MIKCDHMWLVITTTCGHLWPVSTTCDIVCDNLEAEVELLHECMENKIVSVPLDELFPIKKQEYEGLNMTSTIVALDLLRFFYKVNNIYSMILL